MNVLILAQYFPPDIGGSATRALNIAKGLVANGCKVTVVTAFPHYPHGRIPKQYRWRPIKVEWFGRIKVIRTFILPLESRGITRRMFLFASFAVSSLFALPMVGKTDVVWAANPDILSMLPTTMYGKLKRSPITTNIDDLSIEDVYDLGLVRKGSLMSRLIELIAKVTYRRAEAITPISPAYIEPISRTFGVRKEKIHLVRGGVDVSIFKPNRTQHHNRGRKFMVLYSGAFSVAYDFGQVLKAAKIIQRDDSEIEFILQGKGELIDSIRQNVRKYNLGNLRIMDEVLSREKVAELLNGADVLIQPIGDFGKPHLGISAKLYEYQAVGKPVICSSSGTPGHYISETKSGIVTKPGDYKAFAAAVIYLKKNPNVAHEMGRNGRNYVTRNVSIERIGLQMKRILQKLQRSNETSKRDRNGQ